MLTTHRTRTAALVVAAAAALTLAGAGAAQAAPAIPLSVGQETPRPEGAGGAHGFFSYEIGEGELCYTLEVTGLSTPAVAAHVHLGDRNVAGGIVIPLDIENETSFAVDTCVPADQAVLDAIAEDPGAYYVNVHTSMNQPGEVRGQLK